MSELTQLLAAARRGDTAAADTAFRLLYADLHQLARLRLRPQRTATLLDTTALVHEAYLKLVGAGSLPPDERHHFFVHAARVMRAVIVDIARDRRVASGVADAGRVVLDTALGDSPAAPENDVLRVHAALQQLGPAEPRLSAVVEMRYFGGLGEAEIATALKRPERLVRRDWEKARLLLLAAIRQGID